MPVVFFLTSSLTLSVNKIVDRPDRAPWQKQLGEKDHDQGRSSGSTPTHSRRDHCGDVVRNAVMLRHRSGDLSAVVCFTAGKIQDR
ncbi:MAG: hypothetical protein QF785_11385 [Phycisphaeraceae bacterium]|jgi:hypothetical protein|nr:hypothetical protein [Phycisphaeraceae bacterium]